MRTTLFFIGLSLIIQHSALSQSCLPEGITFLTQQEIDNFQTNYPGCTDIEGDVWIHGFNINNLYGLSVLTEIGGELLVDSTQLTDLQGLNSLTNIGADLQIARNGFLDHLNGLDALTEISGTVFVSFSGVKNFLGMPEIASIGGLEIYYTGTESFDGLQGITSINGNLNLSNGHYLKSLTGLENVESINGDLQIFLTGLKSLSGLDNIDPNSIGNLSIYMNDSLSECEVESICNYLAEPGGSFNIHNNATGCNNQEEILDACFVKTSEFPELENSISIYPNPTKNLLFFSTKHQKPITEIRVFDHVGKMVIHKKGVIDKIDISEFQNGIYFIIFQSNATTYMEMIFKI
ncbi:MAG: T9SS type A sorting domain-containing protein [Clostridia bacterium]|nr:T9SS type A sorting domain-containing protein [Clostridia bacterium]